MFTVRVSVTVLSCMILSIFSIRLHLELTALNLTNNQTLQHVVCLDVSAVPLFSQFEFHVVKPFSILSEYVLGYPLILPLSGKVMFLMCFYTLFH